MAARRDRKRDLERIGWREWVSLPDLGVATIKAKVDTGARTSSLHAFELQEFSRRGRRMVRFEVHPEQRSTRRARVVEVPLHDRRKVRSSSGETELRPVICATVELLGERWEVELTLTRRDDMGFRMLLGRQALKGRFVVDPGASFLDGQPKRVSRRQTKTKRLTTRIAILSRKASLYSTNRLKEAAEAAGHEAIVVDYLRCFMNIASHRPQVIYQGEPLEVDAIVPRIGASKTFYGTAVVRQFEMMGVFTLNESQAIARSRDKLRCLQLLSRRGIGLPVTGFAHSTKDVEGVIELVGGAPLVVKLLEGTQGIGVVLCETHKAAASVIEAFRGLDANILVQEFIKEAGGTDIRAFVIGDRVVAAMVRRRRRGEFRSNLHRGGVAEKIKITPEERSTAVRSAKAMGLRVCGVDMFRSNHGPVVMEVNSSPGLEGIEAATGIDVSAAVIKYIEANASKGSKGGRVEG